MQKFKIFKKEKLVIASAVIMSQNSFIQIRNITRVWHGKPEVHIPVFKLLLLLAVAIGLQTTPFAVLSTFVFLGLVITIGYYIYLYCLYTLNLELSSGEVYAFTSMEKAFITKSYKQIKDLINNDKLRNKEYEINFNSCRIHVVKGDQVEVIKGNNVVVNKGNNSPVNVNQSGNTTNVNHSTTNNNNSFNTKIDNNYEVLCKEINELLKMPEVKSNETDFEIVTEASGAIKEKNYQKVKELLKKLGVATIQCIQTTASLATIADLIKNI